MKTQEYENFLAGLYNLVMGQCSPSLEERIKSHEDFEGAHLNGIALLVIVKTIMYSFEERRDLADSLDEVTKKFYSLKQGKYMSLQRYHELFVSEVEVLDEVGVAVAAPSLVKQITADNGRNGAPNADDRAQAKERALAV